MKLQKPPKKRTAKLAKGHKPDAAKLLDWYDRHRRIMPWRALQGAKPNPYHVWLSEIMLQQTTVAAVVPYFQKFIKRWPTIQLLAKASLEDVMRMWAGLGYYRRARGLHECAHIICAEYNGQFPRTEDELLKLPGFGSYTSAAVMAIAFDQRANVVDGNVERVIARLFAIKTPLPEAKKLLRDKAAELLPQARYGDYAQALMDLGATICTPRNPKCRHCPWNADCQAAASGIAEQLPHRIKAHAKPMRQTIAFVLTNKKGEVLLRQRPPTGLLGGMMEIPTSAWIDKKLQLSEVLPEAPITANWQLLPHTIKHVFSHFELRIQVAIGKTNRAFKGHWIMPDKLHAEALPSVMRKIVHTALNT